MISHDDIALLDLYQQTIEMIAWFHTSFHASSEQNPESFRKAILTYFWDEWLTLEEQKHLIYSSQLNVLECIRDQQYNIGRILVNRLVDPKTGTLLYLCENGNICIKSIMDEVIRDEREAIKRFPVYVETTGSIYGIVVPKNGEFVFKTDTPPEEGGKLGRGKECSNVTGMTGHISKLVQVGDVLKRNGKTDFQLNRPVLQTSERKIAGSIRACTLLDLCLRFVNEEQLERKKWFFRPVESYYIGYKGSFRPGRK
jgi:hypothetical protein